MVTLLVVAVLVITVLAALVLVVAVLASLVLVVPLATPEQAASGLIHVRGCACDEALAPG